MSLAIGNFLFSYRSKFLRFCFTALPFLLLLGFAAPAGAACQESLSANLGHFGPVSSLDISTPKTTSISDAGLECFSPFLQALVIGDRANGMFLSANQSRLVHTSTGEKISYEIYADPLFSELITPGINYNFYNNTILSLLGIFGGGNASFPVYLRSSAGAINVSAGTYTDTLTVNWDWRVCEAGTPFVCLLRNTGSSVTILNLVLEITNDCIIETPDVNFSYAPLPSEFPTINQTISVQCTKGIGYSVGLSEGNNSNGTQRRMANGNNYLAYDIFKGTVGLERWGSTGLQRRTSDEAELNGGVYNGVVTQGFYYRANVLPDQPAVQAGNYTDTIIVDISF